MLFRDMINVCNIMDMEAMGSKFTLRGPMHNNHTRIFEHLDIALCNELCHANLHNVIVKTLHRIDFSNSHPILICMEEVRFNIMHKPFRFKDA